MAKRFKNKTLLLTCVMIIVAGCYEKVDWDFPLFEPKPVMNSILVEGSPVRVHVSLAVAYRAEESVIAEDAEVRLYIDGVYAETLVYREEGYYQSQQAAETGKEYVCEVHLDDFPVVRGSAIIPKPARMLDIEYIHIAGTDEEGIAYPALKLTFENNPDIFTCYEVIIYTYRNYGRVGQRYHRAWVINFTDPVLLNEGLPITVFSNEIIDDDSYTMTINYTTGQINHDYIPFRVEFRTVCQYYYKYARQLYLYEYYSEEPFFTGGVLTPFTLFSNIENGFGIFAGFSSVTSAVIIPEE